MSEIRVKALRTFHGDEGFKNPHSEPFSVSRQRFADLKANGLVEEADAAEKAEPQVENKMEAEPANKAAAAPKNKSA